MPPRAQGLPKPPIQDRCKGTSKQGWLEPCRVCLAHALEGRAQSKQGSPGTLTYSCSPLSALRPAVRSSAICHPHCVRHGVGRLAGVPAWRWATRTVCRWGGAVNGQQLVHGTVKQGRHAVRPHRQQDLRSRQRGRPAGRSAVAAWQDSARLHTHVCTCAALRTHACTHPHPHTHTHTPTHLTPTPTPTH